MYNLLVQENDWPDDLSAGLIGSCTNSSYEDMARWVINMVVVLIGVVEPLFSQADRYLWGCCRGCRPLFVVVVLMFVSWGVRFLHPYFKLLAGALPQTLQPSQMARMVNMLSVASNATRCRLEDTVDEKQSDDDLGSLDGMYTGAPT